MAPADLRKVNHVMQSSAPSSIRSFVYPLLRLSAPSSIRSFVASLVLILCLVPAHAQFNPQAISSAVGGTDNVTRILWNSGGGVFSLWRVNADTTVTPYSFGPFTGWSATQVALGADNIPRILWNNTNGQACLYSVNEADGSYTTNTFTPLSGWTAKALAVGGNNTPRLMWNKTDGTMCLYKINTDGTFTSSTFGPYTGYTAAFLAVGPNSIPRVLWNKTDGSVCLWTNADGANPSTTYNLYGPFTGYTPLGMAVDGSNFVRILWNNSAASSVMLGTVDTSGAYTSQTIAYPSGCTPNGLTAAADGSVRVLWNAPNVGTGGSVQLGIITNDGTPGPTTTLSSNPTSNQPQSPGSWVLDHYACSGTTTVSGSSPFSWPATVGLGASYDDSSYTKEAGTNISFDASGLSGVSRSLSGTISPVFVWSGPGSAPGGTVSVLLQSDAYGMVSASNANDGYAGDVATWDTYAYESLGTHVVSVPVTAGQTSFNVPNSPLMFGKDLTGAFQAGVGFNASLLNGTLTGTKPVGNSQEALTGEQITASVSVPTGYTATYSWSVMTNAQPAAAADAFETYNDQAASHQLVLLSDDPSYTTGQTFSFYDKSAETIIIQCIVKLTSTDGKTTFTVTVPFQAITIVKPSVTNWGITGGIVKVNNQLESIGLLGLPGDHIYTDGQSWHDVSINVPKPFVGGQFCFAQLTTPDRKYYRVLLPGSKSSPFYQVLNNGVQGLDSGFPYLHKWTIPNQPANVALDVDSPQMLIPGIFGNTIPVHDDGGSRWNQVVGNDKFTTWLMYQPPTSGGVSVWIPLQNYSWGWSGTEQDEDPNPDDTPSWSFMGGTPSSRLSYTPVPTSSPPTWLIKHTNSDPTGPP